MLNMAIEEVAKGCASSALILMVQELGTLPINLFGTDEQKQRFLPKCATGEWSPAFALSEPDAGSDPGGMRTKAVRDGDEWVIDGTKNWITNLGIADFYICFAVTNPDEGHSRGISAFIVEADRPGFSVGKLEKKMGIRGSPTGQPIFDNVRVPAENLIGEENEGFKVAMSTLDRSRLGVAAQAVGIAQGATDYAAAYAQERQQFGKPIAAFQGIQFKLADMESQTAAARELLYRAASKIDAGEADMGKYSAMAKLIASDTAMRVDHRGGPGARRLRLRQRVPGRADDARREDHPDLRGHERDPAARDRADAELGHRSRPPTSAHPRTAAALLLAVCLAGAASAGVLSSESTSAGAAAPPPLNVVLILTDDQSPRSLAKMPYLGTRTGWHRFANAYLSDPVCCPTRATLLTGLWSHHHGVLTTGGAPKFDDSSTLATWLDNAGYRTGLVGKYHLGAAAQQPAQYVPPGWDEWYEHEVTSTGDEYYNYTLNIDGTLSSHGSAPSDYSTDVMANAAVDFIDRNAASSPFFLLFAPRAPHNPWTPAPRHAGAYANAPVPKAPSYNEADLSDKPAWWSGLPFRKDENTRPAQRREWETLLAVDEAVSRIVGTLEAHRLMKNTVIVYMSDNGYAYGEHRWVGKVCAYEECARTPLLVKYRGQSSNVGTFNQLVSSEDIAPTIADLAEIPNGGPVDGDSLEPFFDGTPPSDWPQEILIEGYKQGPVAPGLGNPPTYSAVRVRGYKYIETDEAPGKPELYALGSDPYEMNSVAGDPAYARLQASLAARLDELRTRPPMP